MKRFALKRITALVLALIMTLSLLPMNVWAEETGTLPVNTVDFYLKDENGNDITDGLSVDNSLFVSFESGKGVTLYMKPSVAGETIKVTGGYLAPDGVLDTSKAIFIEPGTGTDYYTLALTADVTGNCSAFVQRFVGENPVENGGIDIQFSVQPNGDQENTDQPEENGDSDPFAGLSEEAKTFANQYLVYNIFEGEENGETFKIGQVLIKDAPVYWEGNTCYFINAAAKAAAEDFYDAYDGEESALPNTAREEINNVRVDDLTVANGPTIADALKIYRGALDRDPKNYFFSIDEVAAVNTAAYNWLNNYIIYDTVTHEVRFNARTLRGYPLDKDSYDAIKAACNTFNDETLDSNAMVAINRLYVEGQPIAALVNEYSPRLQLPYYGLLDGVTNGDVIAYVMDYVEWGSIVNEHGSHYYTNIAGAWYWNGSEDVYNPDAVVAALNAYDLLSDEVRTILDALTVQMGDPNNEDDYWTPSFAEWMQSQRQNGDQGGDQGSTEPTYPQLYIGKGNGYATVYTVTVSGLTDGVASLNLFIGDGETKTQIDSSYTLEWSEGFGAFKFDTDSNTILWNTAGATVETGYIQARKGEDVYRMNLALIFANSGNSQSGNETIVYYTKDGYSKILVEVREGVENVIAFPKPGMLESDELVFTVKGTNPGENTTELWRALYKGEDHDFWIPYIIMPVIPANAENPLIAAGTESRRDMEWAVKNGATFIDYENASDPLYRDSAIFAWSSVPNGGVTTIIPTEESRSRAWCWRYMGAGENGSNLDLIDFVIPKVVFADGSPAAIELKQEAYPAVAADRLEMIAPAAMNAVLAFDEYTTAGEPGEGGTFAYKAGQTGVLTYTYFPALPEELDRDVSRFIDEQVMGAAEGTEPPISTNLSGLPFYNLLRVYAPGEGYTANYISTPYFDRPVSGNYIDIEYHWSGIDSEQTIVLTWTNPSGNLYKEQVTIQTPAVAGAAPWMSYVQLDENTVVRANPIPTSRLLYTPLAPVDGVGGVEGIVSHTYNPITGELYTTFENNNAWLDIESIQNATFTILPPENATHYSMQYAWDGTTNATYNNFNAWKSGHFWGGVLGKGLYPIGATNVHESEQLNNRKIEALCKQTIGDIEYYYSADAHTRFILLKWLLDDGTYMYEYMELETSSYYCMWEEEVKTDSAVTGAVTEPTATTEGSANSNIKLVTRTNAQDKSGQFFFKLEMVAEGEGNVYTDPNGDTYFTIILPYSFMGTNPATGEIWTKDQAIASGKNAMITHFDNEYKALVGNKGTLKGTFTDRGIEFEVNSFSPFLLSYASHTHPVCGKTCTHDTDATTEGVQAHAAVAWEPITSAAELAAMVNGKNYYLATDITVDSTISISISGTVNLCLNGHTISAAGGYFDVAGTGTLNLCSCEENGIIKRTSTTTTTNALISADAGATANLYNVTLDGGAAWSGTEDIVLERGTTNSGISSSAPLIDAGYQYTAGGHITLNSGVVLQNNACSDAGDGGAITLGEDGTLVINGATICNNANTKENAGAIKAYAGAEITLNSGEIYGNSAYKHGGAVQIFGGGSTDNATAVFTMNGGTIRNNKADGVGGGIAVSREALFNMKGGSITGNSCGASSRGGGVAFSENASNNIKMSISGDAVISGNKKGSADNNLEIGAANTLTVGIMGSNANVGVTRSGVGVFSSGGADYVNKEYFTSDKPAYIVAADGNNLKLAYPALTGVSAQGFSGSYDGNAHGITVTVPYGATVKYGITEGEYTAASPTYTDAGSYTVYYKVTKDGFEPVIGSAVVSISKAPLTVTAKNHTITYGDAPANDGVSYSGFVNGETVSALDISALSYSYDYTRYGNKGSYNITPSGVASDNYTITYTEGVLTVQPKEIGISWTNTTLPYNGSAQKPTATATGVVNNDEVTLTVSGEQTNVGTHTATVSAISNSNYKLPDAKATSFAISAKSLTNPTLTLDVSSFTYDGGEKKPTVTVMDGSTTLTEDTDYTITWPADCASVGTKAVTVTFKGNYSGNKTVEYAIVAADSSCTAPVAVDNLVYTGSAQNLVTAATPTGGTVQYSLSATGTFSESIPTGTDAGTYNVYYKVIGDANHNDTAVLGHVQVSIARKEVTVTAVAKTMTYGEAVPELTYTAVGLIDGQSLVGTLTRAAGNNAGTYAITQGTVTNANNPNYAITFVGADFTITKADASCIAPVAVADLVYTGSAQTLVTAATPTGGTVQYSLSEMGTFSESIPTGTDAGTYYVWYKVIGDVNHNDTAVLGPVQVTISKANQDAPVVGKVDETIFNKNDGKITGVTSAMEYRKDGTNTYTDIVGVEIAGLADGTYYVRLKGDSNHNPSSDTKVVIAAGRYLKVTFNSNGGSDINAITGLTYGTDITEPTAPTKENATFAGWFSDSACTKAWNFDTDTVTADLTLYAKWSDIPVYHISGKVLEKTGDGENDTRVVPNANVKLMLGTTVVAEQITEADGTFYFGGQIAGDYNVVVTYRAPESEHDKVVTALVEVHGNDADGIIVTLPKDVTNSIVEHEPAADGKDSVAAGTLVGGLEDVAAVVRSENQSAQKVEVKLTVADQPPVTGTPSSGSNNEKVQKQQKAIQQKAPGKQLVFFDLSVMKTINNGAPEAITDTGDTLLEIRIPFDSGNKWGITIYRYHGDKAEVLAAVNEGSTTEGFWVGDDGYIHIYTHKFSTYAVGYTVPSHGYFVPVTPDTVTSADTFDAGIVVYVTTSMLAATGSAVVIGKKRKEEN